MTEPVPVKLRARDTRDMEVLSAVLQDALVSPADMAFLEREKRFVMVVSRFRWEHPESDVPPAPDPERDVKFEEAGPRTLFERVNAGVCFDRVRRVRTRGLDLRKHDRILNLLAIKTEPNAITLVFSDGPMVRLEVSAIACHLEDLGEPWATPWRPKHEDAIDADGAEASESTHSNSADPSGDALVLAVPKGRILGELTPLLRRAGIEPEPAFTDESARQLRFATNQPGVEIIRVRSFDAATFVAFGAAQLGVAGNDILMEFDYPEIYAPVDLGIGHCRLVVAEPRDLEARDDPARWSHVRIATKYPEITRRHFAARGVQAECIKLNGAMELAPGLGLCRRIVDLVSSGATLAANDLVEVEKIAEVSSRLIVNRTALKTRSETVMAWIERFREAIDAP